MMLPLASPLSMSSVPVPTPLPVFNKMKKKSVRSNICVRVVAFEKVTNLEAQVVWLNSMELAAV